MTHWAFQVLGGKPLTGEVTVQRSKNAILPMIAAALIPAQGTTILHGVPDIEDVRGAFELARAVGAKVTHDSQSHTVEIDASGVHTHILPADITQKMRGSVLFLAPLIVRLGKVTLPGSGGCNIGERKIDFHHRGFARLGAQVVYEDDGTTRIELLQKKLNGTLLYLDMPSHTGTENLMMAAALAQGETVIENASVEPEVLDFGNFLTQMGAKIHGLGTSTLIIEGVNQFHATEYTPIPDRLVTGLIAMSTGITGGDVVIRGTEPTHLRLVNAKLEQMGLNISTPAPDTLRVQRDPHKRLAPINVTTHPYPGFPTDLQPCISALSTLADGKSYIRERIFENRYDFKDGLISMGADLIVTQNDVLLVTGVTHLKPAVVRAGSIRAGAALLLASLGVAGDVSITNVYQIDRGHERIEELLQQLGANIKRTEAAPSQAVLEPSL